MPSNYWWVNHKQTVKQEINGGYLWAPNTKLFHHVNVQNALKGDFVVSYAHGKISHYGVVTEYPFKAPKPDDFGRAGDFWLNDGWKAPVSWKPLKVPFQPKEHIGRILPFLPNLYAPIQTNGNGNQCYLCKIELPLFEQLMRIGKFNNVHVIDKIEDQSQADIEADTTLDQTEKETIIKARKGQGLFRRNVEEHESCCRVTGLEDSRLLIASHIKPWRLCETSDERLDGANGLLLAPHVDSLFDKGLVTFECDGKVNVSSTLDGKTVRCLGLKNAFARRVRAFTESQDAYLAYHRDYLFLP